MSTLFCPVRSVSIKRGRLAGVAVSLVDLTNVLSRGLFVSVSSLERRVEIASRGSDGRYCWLVLDRAYHTRIVGEAFRVVDAWSETRIPRSVVKRAMFEYLLRVLNGQEAAVFRLDQKVARDHNRVNRERKRLARKRSRAAKRERRREEELVTRSTHTCKSAKAQLSRPGAPSGLRGSRCDCGKSFASRRRRSRHFAVCPLRSRRRTPLFMGVWIIRRGVRVRWQVVRPGGGRVDRWLGGQHVHLPQGRWLSLLALVHVWP